MINLEKGQRISMEEGLKKVGVGLGWDPNKGTGYDFDLDASAFMLGKNGKCPKDEYFVFYNNQVSPDGSVASSGMILLAETVTEVMTKPSLWSWIR